MAINLSPEGKLGLSLTTGVLVYGIYQLQMPTHTDIRTVEAGNADVEASEKTATWIAATTVAGISLIAKSPEVFVIGGLITVAMAWTYRHANAVNPLTKKATASLKNATALGAAQTGNDSENVTSMPSAPTTPATQYDVFI